MAIQQMTQEEFDKKYGPQADQLSSEQTAQPQDTYYYNMSEQEFNERYRPELSKASDTRGFIQKGWNYEPSAARRDNPEGDVKTHLYNATLPVRNLGSSAMSLVRGLYDMTTPINPFKADSKFNIGGNIYRGVESVVEKRAQGKTGKEIATEAVDAYTDFVDTVTAWPIEKVQQLYDHTSTLLDEEVDRYGSLPKGYTIATLRFANELADPASRIFLEDPLLIPTLLYTRKVPSKVRGTAGVGATGEVAGEVAAKALTLAERIKQARAALTSKMGNTKLQRGIVRVEKELASTEQKYSRLRQVNKEIPDGGEAIRNRIAQTNVLDGAVDSNGLLDAATAIKNYRALRSLDKSDSSLRVALANEGTTTNLARVGRELTKSIQEAQLGPAELVSAMNRVQRELKGLKMRANSLNEIPLEYLQDAKIAKDYSKPVDRALQGAYRKLIENTSTLPVKRFNKALAPDIAVIDRLRLYEKIGVRVNYGKMGKYFSQISGNIVGGAVGNVFGGPVGMAMGTVLGGETAGAITGARLKGAFRQGGGMRDIGTDPVFQEVFGRQGRSLKVADKAVGAPKGTPRTKEVAKLEREIKENVLAQKEAAKKKQFAYMEALKDVYDVLVDDLKTAVKQARGSALGKSNKGRTKAATQTKQTLEKGELPAPAGFIAESGSGTEIGITSFRGKPVSRVADTTEYYGSTRAKGFENSIERISDAYSFGGKEVKRTAGFWEGSIEPSYMMKVNETGKDVQAFAAVLAKGSNQDAVVLFSPSKTGAGTKYTFTGVKDPDAFLKQIKENGISGATVVDDSVILYDIDNSLKDSIIKLKKNNTYGAKAEKGDVAFIDRGSYDEAIKKGVGDSLYSKDRITKDQTLKGEDAKIQDRTVARYEEGADKLADEYIETFGKVVNTDEARKLFKVDGYNGVNAPAVHEASSAIAKDVYIRSLIENPEPNAILYAGGAGTGKTSVSKQLFGKEIDNAAVVLDGNLAKISSAKDRIAEAIKAGKKPKVIYTYRDLEDAWVNGVIKRMLSNPEEGGRTVKLSVFLNSHFGSLKVAQEIAKTNPTMIRAIDNSLGRGKHTVMSLDKLNGIVYNTDARERLLAITKELYDRGHISKVQYEALTK